MFDADSRYAKRPLKTYFDHEGREIIYVSRRIIPASKPADAEIKVQTGDRLDLIADRAYGEPRFFWRVADANLDREPDKLTEEAERKLKLNLIKPELD